MKLGRTDKISLFFFIILFLTGTAADAQSQFGDRTYGQGNLVIQEESYFTKPVQIIDMPTASILRGGAFRAGAFIAAFGFSFLSAAAISLSIFFSMIPSPRGGV